MRQAQVSAWSICVYHVIHGPRRKPGASSYTRTRPILSLHPARYMIRVRVQLGNSTPQGAANWTSRAR